MTQKVQTTEEVMQENYWTPSDKKDHKTIYSTELLVENCNEMDATNTSNPTDAYLITYRSPDGDIRRDLVRTKNVLGCLICTMISLDQTL